MKLTLESVLIVDDEIDMRSVVKDYIFENAPGVKVFEAGNGAEGFRIVKNQKIDLVITDLVMPRMSGKTFISSLGALPPSLRPQACFVISGQIEEAAILRRMGGVTFFGKPVNREKFALELRNHFSPATGEAQTTPKIDITFINPFIEATLEVLEMTSGINAMKEKVFIRKAQQSSGDISALIALNCEKYLGSFSVSFEEKFFLALIYSILGKTYTAITAEIQDAAAEICNQIFEIAKKALTANGHVLQPAIPTVIAGNGHTIQHPVGGVCIAVVFGSNVGNFQVEAVLIERPQAVTSKPDVK